MPSYGAAGPYPGPVPNMPPGYGFPHGYPTTAGAAYYNGVPTAYCKFDETKRLIQCIPLGLLVISFRLFIYLHVDTVS